MMVAKDSGKGNGELLFNGDEVLAWEDDKVLEMDGAIVAQECKCTKCH